MSNKKSSNKKSNARKSRKGKEKPKNGKNLDALFEAAANDDVAREKNKADRLESAIWWIAVAGVLLALAFAFPFLSAVEDDAAATTSLPPRTLEEKKSATRDHNEQPQVITKIRGYKILKTLPHDTKAFTQGLTFRPDNSSIVYESTGMYDESEIRVLDLETGTALQEYKIPAKYFGEGMTYVPPPTSQTEEAGGGRLVLITYKEQTGMIFDVDTLYVLEEFQYNTTTTEGWGITYVGKDDEKNIPYDYIVTDGSAFLHFWDSDFQEVQPKQQVLYRTEAMAAQDQPAQPLQLLNELEWDASTQTLLANVWFQDFIIRIDPKTGFATTFYDLRSLYTDRIPNADVFNGIALSSAGDVWVTGKYWPHLYQIELGEE